MANTNTNEEDESWDIKFRQDEEMEFFTELALHETERWISAVTRKKFKYTDDFRKSLENGVLLCETLNNIKPGSVKRINKLPTPIAGLDNINVFLNACKKSFGLTDKHLFDPCDLEDLSQRAIAESQFLKQEVDRRAINVAITVYWLGKSVEHTYSGPHIDQSAFGAFVRHHGKDLISDNHLRNESFESNEHSSAYSSHDSYSKVSNNDSVEPKNICDSSYESYGSYTNSKESELSFNLEEDENMPASNRSNMRRYGSAGSLNSTGGYQFSAATNSINVDSRYDMAHQSNPDLINNHHRRGSSTDSMDSSSYYGNHSRQSSNEGNVDIPTRMLKSQRKTSTTSMDPLQFVKAKPSQKLAEEAEKQIQAAKEVKKVRTIIEKEDDDWYQPVDEAGEWQSNLSSWKHKRRRASAATYQRVEETDQNALEEEEKRKPKTYAQMMENREKRKSTGTMSFYPIDDDDDDDWLTKKPEKPRTKSPEPVEVFISPSRITKIESSPVTKRQPLTRKDRSSSLGSETYVKYNNEDVADWAKNDEDNGNNNKKESEEKGDNSTEIQQDNLVEDVSYKSRKPVEKNKFPRELKVDNDKESHSSSKKPWTQNNEKSVNSGFKNSSDVSMATKSTSKISNLLKSFEKKEDNVIVNSDKPKKSFEFNVESGRKRAMWQERDKGDVKAPMPRASGNYNDKYSKDEKSSKPKDFVEKNIKINQKPNNAKGFGFLITGGVDKKQPVVVQKVNIEDGSDEVVDTSVSENVDSNVLENVDSSVLENIDSSVSENVDNRLVTESSAADVCELEMKDQIISVNKRDISHMTQPQVQRIIDDAVKVGQIDLKVKRQVLEEEDEMDDDAFEAHPTLTDDTFKPIQSQHRSFSPVQSQHRSFSPNQSQHRSYSPVQSQQRSRSPVQSQQRSRSPVHSQHRSFSPTQQRSSPVTFQQRSSPLLRKERSSPSPLTNQQQNVSPPVPAKRPLPANRIETYDSSLTNKVEDDIESEKMWILQQLGMKTETNNNDTKPEESESESEEEEEPTQTQDFKPEIVFNKETTPTLHETPTNVETEVLERPTITRRQYQKPNRANIETIITPVAQMSVDSPPPPPREAPPPLKPSTLDVEGFKPPDILKRWQQGSRSRSDYSSSPNSLDSDSEKRLSSSSITWQNERKQYKNIKSQSEASKRYVAGQKSYGNKPYSYRQSAGTTSKVFRRTKSDSVLKIRSPEAGLEPSGSINGCIVSRSLERGLGEEHHSVIDSDEVFSVNSEKVPNRRLVNSNASKLAGKPARFYSNTTSSKLFRNSRTKSDETYARLSDIETLKSRSRSEETYGDYEERVKTNQNRKYSGGQSSPPSWQNEFKDSAKSSASGEFKNTRHYRKYDAHVKYEDEKLADDTQILLHSPSNGKQKNKKNTNISDIDLSEPAMNSQIDFDSKIWKFKVDLERMENELLEREIMEISQEFDNAEANNTQRNSSNDKEQSDSYQQQYDAKVGQPVMLQIDASQNSQLIIDPRNQMGYVEEPTIAQYTFHVNMPKPNEGEELHGVGERDRIKDEDQKWREEEKKRIELEEKEEQLRRQEEQIRLERERLKQEQEKIQQEKERIERRKHLESEEMSNLYNSYPGRREMNGNDRPNESVTQFSVNINTNQAMPRKLETVWAPNNNLHKEKERWSREDMLAMNRKPTPLQNKPENENMEDMPDPQVTRAAPTRQDRHNLNAVPKPRYRVSEDWKQSQKPDEQNDVPLRRKSEYVNTNSHWLVEEAERRRQQDKSKRHSVHTPFSRGPIKPVQDGLSNKWMDDTSVLHRQTYSANNSLTSPRSLSTRQFSAKPQSQLSQTLPANFNMNKIQKKEPPVPPKPVRSSPNPQSPTSPPSHAEQIMAVSGKQLCSHCNNELGFGAAMVIESLGLYYHVQCFRCCVCQTCLGNGSQGADVRVRVNKLHCRNCYSNDEAGLKFSKV